MKVKPTIKTCIGTMAVLAAVYLGYVFSIEILDLGILGFSSLAILGISTAAVLWELFDEMPEIATIPLEGPIQNNEAALHQSDADDVVEAIEECDSNPDVEAIVLEVDSPGGEVPASEDIRRAIEEFDGPTVAVAKGICASGAYLAASECSRVIAHTGSLVGSIGVKASRPIFQEFADDLGIDYAEISAGEYKEAGNPLQELDGEDREYLEGIVDEYYGQFVDAVAENRAIGREAIEATEAKVFTASQAVENGLVDELGTADDAEDWIERELGSSSVSSQRIEVGGLFGSAGAAAGQLAYSFGAGVADRIGVRATSFPKIEFRP